MQHYEGCGYVVDPSKFPSRRAKTEARKMPRQQWPESRARRKKAGSVSEDWQMEEEEDTEEQQLILAAEAMEGNLLQFLQTQAGEMAENVSRPA